MSESTPTEVIFVDHSAQLGGAELALWRYLQWQGRQLKARLILFAEGPLAERVRRLDNADVTVLQSGNPLSRIWELNRLLSTCRGMIVANSLSALSHLAVLPGVGGRLVCYLRQEAVPDGAPFLKRQYLTRIALPRCHAFLANSDWTARTLPLLARRNEPTVVYTVSGVRDEDVLMTKVDFNQEDKTAPLRVLSLSRLSPWKGIDVIVEAVKRVNSRAGRTIATLTIAGANLFNEDQYSNKIRQSAEEAAGAIEFVGHVEDVQGLIDAHDVVVSASITPEPFGQVLIQSLSRGCLTIGTNQGGAKEILSDYETGLLVPPGDVNALADALTWAIDHPAESAKIRTAGLLSCGRFTDQQTLPLLDAALMEEALSLRG